MFRLTFKRIRLYAYNIRYKVKISIKYSIFFFIKIDQGDEVEMNFQLSFQALLLQPTYFDSTFKLL